MNVDAMERACWAAGHLDDRASAARVNLVEVGLCHGDTVSLDWEASLLAVLWSFARLGTCFEVDDSLLPSTKEIFPDAS